MAEDLEKLLAQKEKIDRKIRAYKSQLSKNERKERTRKLIQIGGLAVIAGIDTWDNGTLLGALCEINELNKEPGKSQIWKQNGDIILKKREEMRKEGKK